MRSPLDALRRSGVVRARFSALFGGRTPRGYYALQDVQTPTGQSIDHIWIRPHHWHGRVPTVGEQIEFRAQIEPYWRNDGSEDLGLFKLVVL